MTLIRNVRDLKVLPELNFEEKNHTYKKSNAVMPSVTQLMKVLTGDIYGSIDPVVLAQAAARGTDIHEACEIYDRYNYIGIVDSERKYFDSYVNYKKEHNVKSIANEVKLYHKMFLYAGTLDVIAVVDGKVTLLDIKTTAVLHDKLVAVQLAGYLSALNSWGLTVDQCAVIQLKSDGNYVYKVLEPDFNTFKACIQIQAYKNRKE